ncbi:NRDE family protein [Mesonia maritima]|uniref:NRDE family protein n=1 Tax=Mesonia maritima TaxID=1793873 RepID=UPI00363A2196
MCTITFIPLLKEEKGFVVTSNRDESANRKTLPPKVVEEKGVKLLYPKDEVAGGTWIGASGKKRLICLMNGAFKPHQRKSLTRQVEVW